MVNSRHLSLQAVVRWIAVVLLALAVAGATGHRGAAVTSSCTTSGPTSGLYTVTVCIDQPATGAALSGNTTVSTSVGTAGPGPGVQRMRFFLDGDYLLTDFAAPYVFTIPTAKFVDGARTLEAEALLRDGFTSERASVSLEFENGVSAPPPPETGFAPSSGRTPASGEPFIAAAAGDGASGEAGSEAVTDLVANWNPNLFLYLGDVYEKGTSTEFHNWYGDNTAFGQFRSVTDPTVGNHEYEGSDAPGYFDYWNSPPNYYSTDANGWHIVSLNSTSQFDETDVGSAQYQWLTQDLDASAAACTLVFFHHPRFSVGPQGDTVRLAAIWALLAQKGVDVVLTGHDHDYQRWVPLDGAGNPAQGGITEFVVGTGGHGAQGVTRSDPRLAVSAAEFGALRLELNAGGASYRFLTGGGTTLDSGSVQCGGVADTAAPSAPTNLSASVAGARVDLSWSPSTDDVGVTGYEIYRDGQLLDTNGQSTRYSDTTAEPRTAYTYFVVAFDASGRRSPQSSPVTVTTLTETTLFSDGFESGDLRLWTSFTNMSTQQPGSFSGSWSGRANGAGLAAWGWKQLPQPQTQLYYRTRFKIVSQSTTVNLLKFRTETGSSILGLFVASNGKLGYRNDVLGSSTTSSTIVTQGVWHALEVHATIAGAAGQTETWLDGQPIGALTRSENLGTLPIGRIQIGENSGGRTFDIFYDAVAVDPARMVDESSPDVPLIDLEENSTNEYVNGTTLFYNPSPGRSGSFTVTAVSHDADSGLASIAFPSVFAGEGDLDQSSPHMKTYSWAAGANASGPNTVTASNGVGLSSNAAFTTIPDTTPPTGGSISYGDGYVSSDEVVVRLSEGSDSGVGVDADGDALERSTAGLEGGVCGTFGPYVSIIDIPSLDFVDPDVSSGHCYRYRFVVPDLVGNQTVHTTSAVAKVDTLPPTVALADPGNQLAGLVELTATAFDEGGSDLQNLSFEYSVAGSASWTLIGTDATAPFAASWDTTAIADGLYDVRAVASDGANGSSVSSWTVQVSNTGALSIAISSPRSFVNGSDPDPFAVTATSPDALAQVEFFACSDPSLDCSTGSWDSLGVDTSSPFTASWPLPSDGNRAVRVVGTDSEGQTTEDEVNVVVDRAPPTGGSVSYPDGWNATGTVTVTADAGTDTGSGIAVGSGLLERSASPLDGTGCGSFSPVWTSISSPDTGLQSGKCYRYRFRISDNAGNFGIYTSANVVKVDTSPPSRPAGATATPVSSGQIDLAWAGATDDVAVDGYRVRRDGAVVATLGSSARAFSDVTVSPETTYVYTVQAFDQAGNGSVESTQINATTPAPPLSTITVEPVADAYVTISSQTRNFGNSAQLRVDASPDTRSYLRFHVNGATGAVRSATLRIFATSNLTAGYEVRRVASTTWAEGELTYSNAPPVGSLEGVSGPVVADAWNEIDVTSVVTGDGDYSFALTPLSTTALALASREGAGPPELVVELDTSGNRAPSTGDVSVTTNEDTSTSWTPDVADPDGDALTCVVMAAPAHGQATVEPDCSSGTYTPEADYAGADTFTYQASDGSLFDEGDASVSVAPVDDAPVAVDDAYTAISGTTLSVDALAGVLSNDTDVEGDALSASLLFGPSIGSLSLSPDGSFDYTAPAGFSGVVSFTYAAGDGTSTSNLATVTITVTAAPSTLSFAASADAYVNQSSPDSNFGSGTALRADGSPILRSYLRFNVAGVVGTVTQARLRLWATSSFVDQIDVSPLAAPATSWSEGTITWSNAPALGPAASSAGPFSTGSWVEFDVTPLVSGNGAVTFVVGTVSTRAVAFESKEAGVHPPQLVVDMG